MRHSSSLVKHYLIGLRDQILVKGYGQIIFCKKHRQKFKHKSKWQRPSKFSWSL